MKEQKISALQQNEASFLANGTALNPNRTVIIVDAHQSPATLKPPEQLFCSVRAQTGQF